MITQDLCTKIPVLGKANIASPIIRSDRSGKGRKCFISDESRIIVDVQTEFIQNTIDAGQTLLSFEQAGPREKIYFDPSKLKCAVVTCGGLCPGLNDIIRAIVLELYHIYHVKTIYGIRHGLQGFVPEYEHDVMDLTPASVAGIQDMGGTILGSSRGSQDIGVGGLPGTDECGNFIHGGRRRHHHGFQKDCR